ncbi:hypothetical protein D3C87_125070 [compost metagenome]
MSPLTGKDIIAIIKAGSTSGVQALELGELKIHYKGNAEPLPEPYQYPLTSNDPTYQSSESSFTNELDDSLLMVADPVAYEERVLGVKHNVET